ncbi:MAG: tRNA lysidine(34) synthetase TilS [Oscillospiraceae bacterium]|nr:tRNA lysidine(34) synthetase TilS [Oscillospiraceae bacterium]
MKNRSKDALTEKVLEWIGSLNLVSKGEKVLCAFSGGADSVAMTLILHENREALGIDVVAAHVNHMLRGAEADRDEEFCRCFCERHGIPFYPLRGDAAKLAAELGTGTEDAARTLRYSLLSGISADRIAVAHNADDNLETVVMRLARGGGTRGLSGIPPVNGKVIRPIMVLSRSEVEEFCRLRSESWVTDSTNLSDDYTRNKIRHRVISELKELNPNVCGLVLENSLRMRAEDAYLDREAEELIAAEGGLTVRILEGADPVIAKRMIRIEGDKKGVSLDGKTVEKLLALSLSGKSRFYYHVSGCRFVGEYGRLRFEKSEEAEEFCFELSADRPVETARWRITMVPRGSEIKNVYRKFNIFSLNSDKIQGTLVVRSRRSGDMFSRNRGAGTKKLSRVFSDMKTEISLRNTLPLLADDGGVIYVPMIGANSRREPAAKDPDFDIIFEEKD